MPESGDLILEMPPRGGDVRTMSAPGILYTNDGTDNPPATLGYLERAAVCDQLRRRFLRLPDANPGEGDDRSGGRGVTTAFDEGQKLGA